jgi:CHAT domain-containing protein
MRCWKAVAMNRGAAVLAGALAFLAFSPRTARPESRRPSFLLQAAQSFSDHQEYPVLEPGKSFERALTGGENYTFEIALQKDAYAGVVVEQRGVDVVVQVLNLGGKLLAEFDSESRKEGQEFVGLVADSGEGYRLRIKAVYPGVASGRYEIHLAETHSASDSERSIFESHKLRTEAQAQLELGKYDEAIRILDRALPLAEIPGVPQDAYVGELLHRMAILKRLKGDYKEAESLFERAVTLDQRVLGREHPQTADALRAWGNLYIATAEYAKAEPLLEEGLEISERTLGSQHPTVALGLRLLANLHGFLEDLERARTYLERALAIAERSFAPDDVSLIAIVHDLGDIYRVLGDFDRAEPLLQRAADWVEKKYGPEHIQLASPLNNLGSVAVQRKEYARALALYERAHAIREKTLGAQHPDTVRLLSSMANVYADQGDFGKARELHQQALDLLSASAGPYHRATAVALDGIARSYAAQGNLDLALQYQARYDEVLAKQIEWNLGIGSDRERLAYLHWVSSQTDRTVSIHVQQAPDKAAARDLALSVLLERKGRGLDAMSGSITALRARLNPDDRRLLDELGETDSRLANLSLAGPGKLLRSDWQKQLVDLGDRRERLESAVSDRSAEFRAQWQPVTIATVRNAIPADAALIEFASYRTFDSKKAESQAYGESRYVVYVLRRSGDVQWRDLGPVEQVDVALAALRQALRDPRRTDVRELARAADRKVMASVRSLVGDAKHILVSPDGALNLIPFEALLDQQGHYLLERYSISYLTTGRDLLRFQVPRKSNDGPVLFANPAFGEPGETVIARARHDNKEFAQAVAARRSIVVGDSLSSMYFAPLAGTAREANAIRSLFPEASLLTGEQATKAALRGIHAPSILHIATHGFFLGDVTAQKAPGSSGIRASGESARVESPLLRSGLALAGANLTKGSNTTDDGIFTALEASNLNLWGTRLVTLSACDTGVGEVKNGEGVYGLRRAFFLAGTESLVMSLWPVSDNVTRELMTRYYSGLKKGLGRGEALRQSQLAMLKRKGREHPFYWASFIQAGEWAPL